MATRLGSDIVYSPDDGGWYAVLFRWDDKTEMPGSLGRSSPVYQTKQRAEAWARQRGAEILLYP